MIKRLLFFFILGTYFSASIASDYVIENNIHFICPVDSGKIVSAFGKIMHPILKTVKRHNGIDIKANPGANVYSTAQGKVIFSGNRKGYGESVCIKHSGSYSTFYAHLQKLFLKKGQVVRSGEIIGSVGNTGLSSAPHLHYEIRKNDIAVNPMPYLNCGEKIRPY